MTHDNMTESQTTQSIAQKLIQRVLLLRKTV